MKAEDVKDVAITIAVMAFVVIGGLAAWQCVALAIAGAIAVMIGTLSTESSVGWILIGIGTSAAVIGAIVALSLGIPWWIAKLAP